MDPSHFARFLQCLTDGVRLLDKTLRFRAAVALNARGVSLLKMIVEGPGGSELSGTWGLESRSRMFRAFAKAGSG